MARLVRTRVASPAKAETRGFLPPGNLLGVAVQDAAWEALVSHSSLGWVVETDPCVLRTPGPFTLKAPKMVDGRKQLAGGTEALVPRLKVLSLNAETVGGLWKEPGFCHPLGRSGQFQASEPGSGNVGGGLCWERMAVPQLLFASKNVAGKEASTEAQGLQRKGQGKDRLVSDF